MHSTVVIAGLLFVALTTAAPTWPVPYNRTKRPPLDQRCKVAPSHSFCPNGLRELPDFDPNDVIDIFVMTSPVTNFALTPLSGYPNIRAGFGLRSRMTGKNFTITYAPLSSVMDATVAFPFGKKELLWCNQGATCLLPTLTKSNWKSILHIGSIGGDDIDDFGVWILYTNNTAPFYQTFSVLDQNHENPFWIEPFDDVKFVIDGINLLKNTRASLLRNVSITVSLFELHCDQPQKLGVPSEIQKSNPKLFDDISAFFRHLQPSNSLLRRIYNDIVFYFDLHLHHKFYYLFNEEVWKLPMKTPYIKTSTSKYVIS